MGLIRAALKSAGSTLRDQWKEYFYCDSLEDDVLAVKGHKRTTSRSNRGDDNIISSGSTIAVADGQCMIIVEQGQIVEMCAEAGEFVFDASTEPSIFSGSLGDGIMSTFQTMSKRFMLGGETGKDQRVYYFNTKEIIGNKYGTPNPVPFRAVDKNIGLDIDISIRCNGEYSYRIVDPMLFYKNVCGNVEDEYTRDRLDSMLKSELMTALQPAFAKISAMGVRYSELPAYTFELADILNEQLSEKWTKLRGIAVSSFGVNSVTASEEDQQLIKNLQRSAVMRDPTMAAASLVDAQSEAMKTAAGNEGGAMMGFMGLNMAAQSGGMNAQQLYQMGANTAAPEEAGGWVCPKCGAKNSGKFCSECAEPKPSVGGWVCPKCGAHNSGKFCTECAAPKPAALDKCPKCSTPIDPANVPKFCPECGNKLRD